MMRLPDIIELRERRWNARRELEKANADADRWRQRVGRICAAAGRMPLTWGRPLQAQAALGEALRTGADAPPPESACTRA